jgi:carotenoid cleavage dioxygenase-like enzyme
MEPILFKTLDAEVDSLLEINGKIPNWLNGTLLRNGPAKFEQQDKKFVHWFDGYAMLHKFTFQEGKVAYRNRFLRTDSFLEDHKTGEITVSGSGTLPTPNNSVLTKVINLFKKVPLDNTNVNIIDFNNRNFAVSDFSRMIEFDFSTLETKGEYLFNDEIGDKFSLSSAHPCIDVERQEMYNFVCKIGPVVQYKLYCLDMRTGKRRLIKTIVRRQASMIHSTALTSNYYIFIECPERVNFLDLALWEFRDKTLCDAISWNEKDPAIFYIINRKTHEMTVIEHDSFFFFHIINAYEEGDKIIIDLPSLEKGGGMNNNFIDKILEGGTIQNQHTPTRFEIDLTKKKISTHLFTAQSVELPQIHPSLTWKKYRYAYCMGLNIDRKKDFFNQLTKLDTQTGKCLVWHEAETYPSEAIFVPHPQAKEEDEGVALSVVLDTKNKSSFLLVLDGKTFEEVARVTVPHLIPMGFHGHFYPYVKENEFEKAIKSSLVQEGFTLRKVFK